MKHTINIHNQIPSYPPIPDSCILSIETTGLHADISAIFSIGIGYWEGEQFLTRQWLQETGLEEKELLLSFFEALSGFTTIITYYGNRFALPFLEAKIAQYQLEISLSDYHSVDLYETLYPIRKQVGLSSCKLASAAKYFNAARKKEISGRKRIAMFQKYRSTKDEALEQQLMAYQQDSLLQLESLCQLLAYDDLKNGKLTKCFVSFEKEQAIFSFVLPVPLILPLQYEKNSINIIISEKNGKVLIPLSKEDQIQHFIPNYKDYYYLIEEDRAIHKSLASYIGKDYKKKATADTCYEWISTNHKAFQSEETRLRFLKDLLTYIFC